jgi:CRP-like cAMP-binding protein
MDATQLRSSALFEGLSATDLERCAELFEEREFPAGASLARQGDFAYRFFIVLRGEVEVNRDFETIATLGPGDFFGEVGLLTRARRNARVTARTRCVIASMMTWDFDTMTAELPEVGRRLEAAIAERDLGS